MLDQDEKTSWFSDSNDSVTKGTQPWILFSLSRPARLHLVKVLGNRNPTYPHGYSVTTLRMETLDSHGQVLSTQETSNPNPPHDFFFLLDKPIAGVEGVRLVVLADEGAKNSYGDVALGEVSFEFSQEER